MRRAIEEIGEPVAGAQPDAASVTRRSYMITSRPAVGECGADREVVAGKAVGQNAAHQHHDR